MTDEIENIKKATEVVATIIQTAGSTPEAKKAAQNLGKAAVTVTGILNVCLLPIAAINYCFDEAKIYFQEEFKSDVERITRKIKPEKIVSPKASIAGPIVQGLAFAHSEQSLKEMYLGLLATAMDEDKKDTAKPAFVDIIRQLDTQDANLLLEIMSYKHIPIVEIRISKKNSTGWTVYQRHVTSLFSADTSEPVTIPNYDAFIDNLIRLGLIEVDYAKHLVDDKGYEWVEMRPEYLNAKNFAATTDSIANFQKGVLAPTAFGRLFADATNFAEIKIETKKE